MLCYCAKDAGSCSFRPGGLSPHTQNLPLDPPSPSSLGTGILGAALWDPPNPGGSPVPKSPFLTPFFLSPLHPVLFVLLKLPQVWSLGLHPLHFKPFKILLKNPKILLKNPQILLKTPKILLKNPKFLS